MLTCNSKHILFDGVLPDFKFPIRMSREQALMDTIIALKKTAPAFAIDFASAYRKQNDTVSCTNVVQASPPFLIPVLLDALLGSEFADRVKVLPAEADAACVAPRFSGKHDIILTSDSDLVVLGPSGRVMFFMDLDVSIRGKATGLIHNPRKLAESLQTERLLETAYFLAKEIRVGLPEAAAKARALDQASEDLKKDMAVFGEQYASPSLEWVPENLALSTLLSRSESRLSEIVYQSLLCGPGKKSVHLFLPTVLEDSDRVSALRASRDIRSLALSVLSELSPHPRQYFECDRVGKKMEMVHVDILSTAQLIDRLYTFVSSIERLFHENSKHSKRDVWRLFALSCTLGWTANELRTLPKQEDIVRYASARELRCTWASVHLAAQIEGVLASVRLLKQVLEVRKAYLTVKQPARDAALDQAAVHAQNVLDNLPLVVDLVPFHCSVLVMDIPEQSILKGIGKYYEEPPGKFERQRKQKKKQGKEQLKAAAPKPASTQNGTRWASSNAFAMLDENE